MVHYRRFPDSIQTIESVLAAGISPEHFYVVDTSEDGSTEKLSTHCARLGVSVHGVPNRGYGAAVNHGMSLVHAATTPYTLVLTHEVILEPGALARMVQLLNDEPAAAVVGPTLVDLKDVRTIWSTGGALSPTLNMPVHQGTGASDGASGESGPVARDWLDGACCLYRTDLLVRHRIREDFFLYFEETDLHTRLRKYGYSVYWVPQAIARQSSDGIPAYYLARNLQLFQRLHGRWWHRLFSVPLIAARRVAGRVLRCRHGAGVRDLLRGWRDGSAHRLSDRS